MNSYEVFSMAGLIMIGICVSMAGLIMIGICAIIIVSLVVYNIVRKD